MKYTVTGKSVELTGGVLTLTAEQAATRKHLLKATDKKSQYEIIKPVIFKHGEKFGYEGDLPKAAGVDKSEAKAAEAKAAEAKAAEAKAAEAKAAEAKAAEAKAAEANGG